MLPCFSLQAKSSTDEQKQKLNKLAVQALDRYEVPNTNEVH